MRRMRYLFHSLILILNLIATCAFAQEIKVRGGFIEDSIRIGEPVAFSVSIHYPEQLTVLFPDSTFRFEPFEFSSKVYFPTKTREGVSYDSVVYKLTSFEIDKVQRLQLPVFITTAKDCTVYLSQPDSIFLVELVKNLPSDSVAANNLPLKTNTFYEKVFSEFNYMMLGIVAGVITILLIVSWIFFGKRIIRYFKFRKLQKNHKNFMDRFATHVKNLNASFSREQTEQTLSLWKKYMEQLEQKPYTKLTTRETIAMVPDGQLKNDLQLLDKSIYGNQTTVIEPLQNLQKVADQHFHKKLELLKNG